MMSQRNSRFFTPALIVLFCGCGLANTGLASSATANQTTTYNYDTNGSLTQSCHAISSNQYSYRSVYALDPSGNRSQFNLENEVINITSGASIHSQDGRFLLSMQTDGNFVLYGPKGFLWSANTYGSGAVLATMQNDGNLALYTANGTSVWTSGTSNNYCARLSLQNDGNLVVYSATNQALWSTGTSGN